MHMYCPMKLYLKTHVDISQNDEYQLYNEIKNLKIDIQDLLQKNMRKLNKTMNLDEIETALKYIRSQIKDLFGPKASTLVRVLYGGSVDDHNAHSILSLEDCDGALIGGASLNYQKFGKIVDSAYRVQQQRLQE